jgi:four helix bundle protein
MADGLLAVGGMVRRYEDLVCYQLANELKKRVYALIAASGAKRDGNFCQQLTNAASSGPANLAEAFGAYGHGESARYARYAKASLTETHHHLRDGVDRTFWKSDDVEPLLTLARRAIGATVKWIRYLSESAAPE